MTTEGYDLLAALVWYITGRILYKYSARTSDSATTDKLVRMAGDVTAACKTLVSIVGLSVAPRLIHEC